MTAAMEDAPYLQGGGEVGRLMRSHDWNRSPLGPHRQWPQSLRSVVGLLLNSKFPMFLAWGPQLGFLYNDAYAAILGAKHPGALGRPFQEVWPEIWPEISSLVTAALNGEAIYREELPLRMNRHGFDEQTWFTFSYSPVRDEAGAVAGMFCAVAEATAQVLVRRRQEFRLALEERLRSLDAPDTVMVAASAALGRELGIARVGFAEIDGSGEHIALDHDWSDGSLPSISGWHRLESFGPPVIEELRAGRTVAIEDVADDPRVAGNVAAHAALGVRAVIAVPLIRGGALTALLYLHHGQPRRWSAEDLSLAAEVADRSWPAVERARAETRRRAAENRFRALVTTGAFSIYRMSPDWQQLYQLDGGGFLADTAEPRSDWVADYVHPDDQASLWVAVEDAIRRRGMFDLEHRVRSSDGSWAWTHSRAVPVMDGGGRVIEWFGAASDVTPRHQAEERLRESEQRLRLAADAAEIGLWDVDVEAGTMAWPPRVRAMFGIAPEAPVTLMDSFTGLHPDDQPRVQAAYMAAADPARRALFDVEYRVIGRDDGVLRWVAAKGRGLFDEHGRCIRVIGTAIDVSRRKADEARLRELNLTLERRVAEALAERKLLADVVEGTDMMVQIIDRNFRWLAINRASSEEFARIYGVPRPRAGDNMLSLLAGLPDHQAAVRQVWARALAGEHFIEVGTFGDPALDRRSYEMRFSPLRDEDGNLVGAYQFVLDVTDRLDEQARLKEAEAALVQMQKMEAVGQLTGGIAHDFNNLLGAIVGSLDLIRRKPEDIDRVRRFADAGLQAAERGAKLTGQLLAFSRSQRLELKPTVAADVISGMSNLLARTLGPMIRLRFDLAEGRRWVMADPTQLEMAVLNLAINARDAMPGGGELHITTAVREIREDAELAAGRYVELSVSDTGTGMPPEVAARAFDPFFTTKGLGKGTGLGLSQVYGIARHGGGTARLDSRPGQGTRVRLYLPLTAAAPGAAAAAGPHEMRREPVPSATVLVVDDDPDMRGAIVAALEALGYRVVVAEDGEAGLKAARASAPDLVILDFAMPGMNGAELATALRRLRPGLPIVLASGYADTAAIEGIAGPSVPVLRKPFRVDELQAVLADALEAAA